MENHLTLVEIYVVLLVHIIPFLLVLMVGAFVADHLLGGAKQ